MSVYLTEANNRYDLSTLDVHGGLKFLSDRPLNPFDVDHCLKTFKEGLECFDPSEDFICLTGNLQTVSLLMAVAYKKFSTFRVLVFDARISNYKERVIRNV